MCPYFYSHSRLRTTDTPRASSNGIVCPNAYQKLAPRRVTRGHGGGTPTCHLVIPSRRVAFASNYVNARARGLLQSYNSFCLHQTSKIFTCRLTIIISSTHVNIARIIHKTSLLSSATQRLCLCQLLNLRPPHFTRYPLLLTTSKQQLSGQSNSRDLRGLQTGCATPRVVNGLTCTCNLRPRPTPHAPRDLIPSFT